MAAKKSEENKKATKDKSANTKKAATKKVAKKTASKKTVAKETGKKASAKKVKKARVRKNPLANTPIPELNIVDAVAKKLQKITKEPGQVIAMRAKDKPEGIKPELTMKEYQQPLTSNSDNKE